jgi:hypothetical protein
MHGCAGQGLLLGALVLAAGCSGQSQVRYEHSAAESTARRQVTLAPMQGDHQAGTEQGGDPATGSGGVAPLPRGVYVTGDKDTTRRPGGPGETGAPDSPWVPRLTPMDLSGQGFAVRLSVPEGAEVHSQFGVVKISHGPRFSIELTPKPVDLAARRKDIENDSLQHLRRYATDSADTLVYEVASAAGGIGTTEHHFVTNVAAGGAVYGCEDTKGASYTQAEVQAMLDACKSLAGK